MNGTQKPLDRAWLNDLFERAAQKFGSTALTAKIAYSKYLRKELECDGESEEGDSPMGRVRAGARHAARNYHAALKEQGGVVDEFLRSETLKGRDRDLTMNAVLDAAVKRFGPGSDNIKYPYQRSTLQNRLKRVRRMLREEGEL